MEFERDKNFLERGERRGLGFFEAQWFAIKQTIASRNPADAQGPVLLSRGSSSGLVTGKILKIFEGGLAFSPPKWFGKLRTALDPLPHPQPKRRPCKADKQPRSPQKMMLKP